jgi:nucleotide-binding universal stress UspA family protein
MFHNILIATDGSELGDKALAAALNLGKGSGGKVTVLTVTDPVTSMVGGTGGFGQIDAGPLINKLEESYRETAGKVLTAAQQQAQALGTAVETLHLPDHLAADGIIQTVEQRGADLIVMGSHGRRGLGRLLLGSQAAEVLARAKVPVLVVK